MGGPEGCLRQRVLLSQCASQPRTAVDHPPRCFARRLSVSFSARNFHCPNVYIHDIQKNMVKPNKILERCTGFEWDNGNITKNWDRHDVLTGECEQIFFNKPLVVKRDKKHSVLENRYYVLRRTNMNRLLFAVFTIRDERIRIISARDMTVSEIGRYQK